MFNIVIDSKKASQYRDKRKPTHEEFCSMCGDLCAIKLPRRYLRGKED
jgi:phosphomethylpyrimidine synthase